jgi:FkbM family methyltransferase
LGKVQNIWIILKYIIAIIKVYKVMRKIFNLIISKLPFSIRFYIEKNIYQRIDEIDIVYEILKNERGVMIDVGAHFGLSLEPFMNSNWTIHAFEPDPNNRKKLIDRIEGKKNVFLSTQAVTNTSGLELAFYTSDISSGISGLSNFHSSHKETNKVKTITLRDYIFSAKVSKIDFLKIDTEGYDLFVLQGFDWDNHPHPRVIICEFEDKKTIPLGYSTIDMCNFLRDKGYSIIISEWFPIVEYGRVHKWKHFTKELQDVNNGWGNLIAMKQDLEKSFVKYCY